MRIKAATSHRLYADGIDYPPSQHRVSPSPQAEEIFASRAVKMQSGKSLSHSTPREIHRWDKANAGAAERTREATSTNVLANAICKSEFHSRTSMSQHASCVCLSRFTANHAAGCHQNNPSTSIAKSCAQLSNRFRCAISCDKISVCSESLAKRLACNPSRNCLSRVVTC